MTQPTLDVIFRRLPVEPDRKPRRVLPTDIVAVMPYEPANPGSLCNAGFITYSTGGGCSEGEFPLSCYRQSKPVRIDDVPPELIDWLERNDFGEPFKLRVRRRLPSDFREKAWRWPRLGQAD